MLQIEMGEVISSRITDAVRAAIELPQDQRDSFLDSQLGIGTDDRRRAAALVAEQQSATLVSQLSAAHSRPAPSELSGDLPGAAALASRPVGRRLGAYTILGVLGEGGMGMVYRAEQSRPRRTVALKVIRPGLWSTGLLQRFEHEAQVLGRLQHPGIAQIFEAGVAESTDGGQPTPFFAMELIAGVPLNRFVREHALSVPRRLALLLQVCAAVEHAHKKGVIHRDLKPANILVTDAGEPKVLDFGVSRETEGDGAGSDTADVSDNPQAGLDVTRAGQLVGTVPYMSPEQIGGQAADVDTRSDVYTLGVILFELLTGRLPHAVSGKTIADAARIIGNEQPRRLAALDKSLGRELDAIVAKALRKDRAARYQSAAELAADLRRYLHDEPVTALPPTRLYVARKFARRNRALVGGTAVAALLLIAGIVGTAWQAARATAGQHLAETRRVQAEEAEARAKDQAQTATTLSGFLTGMITSVDPENAMGREPTVRELLDKAASNAATDLRDKPAVEAPVQEALGRTYHALAKYDEADAHYRAAIELYSKVHGPESREALAAKRNLSALLADRGLYDQAEAIQTAVVESLVRQFGENDGESIVATSELARTYQETGRTDESQRMFRTCIERGIAVLGEDRDVVMTMIHNLGTSLKNQGQHAEAEQLLRRALALRQKNLGPEHPHTLYSMNNLAALLQATNRAAEAEPLMRQTLELRTKVLGPEHPSTVTVRGNLAVLLMGRGDVKGAEPLARQSLASWTASLGEAHPRTLVAMANVAYICEETGNLDEAEALYRKAIAIRTRGGKQPDQDTLAPMNNLAMLLQRRGQLDAAEAAFQDLENALDGALPPDHFYRAVFRNNHGDCLTDMGRHQQAEELLLDSLTKLRAALGDQHPRTQKALTRLVRLYESWGKPDDAEKFRIMLAAK